MAYRDERDALRGRVQSLEQDLGDAQKELAEQKASEDKRARVEQIEQRMRDAERELRSLSGELAALRGPPPTRRTNVSLVIAVFAVTVVSGAVAALLVLRSAPSPSPIVGPALPAPAIVTAAAPVVEAPIPPEETPPPPPVVRRVKTRWEGKVTRATGLPIAPGAPCAVVANLEGDGQKGSAADLEVTCGGRAVYRSSDKLEGMSMHGSGIAERQGKEPGTLVYALRFTDTGARAGPRTQVSLDTTQSTGVAWSEVVPAFRVEFRLTQESAPVRGERLTMEENGDPLMDRH